MFRRGGISWEDACAAAERTRDRRLHRHEGFEEVPAEPEPKERACGSKDKGPVKRRADKREDVEKPKKRKHKVARPSPSPDVRRASSATALTLTQKARVPGLSPMGKTVGS